MKEPTKSRHLAYFVLAMFALNLLTAACSTAAPQQVEVPVKLGERALDPPTIKVAQDDTVTLKIATDESGTLHLHGYDLEQEITSGEVTDFVFVADATGRFGIAFHPAVPGLASHEEAGHGEEFQSEVMHPGDTFSLEVTHDKDGVTDPPEVMVRPATTIIWTNSSSEMQALASSTHPDAMDMGDEHQDMEPMTVDAGHTHEEGGEGEEVDVGFLEVRPR